MIELNISDNDIGDDGVSIICDNLYNRFNVEEEEEEELDGLDDKGKRANITVAEVVMKKKVPIKVTTKVEGLKILNIGNCRITCKINIILFIF